MREIKFRAWDGNKMVDGDFFINSNGDIFNSLSFATTSGTPTPYPKRDWVIVQFTGLTDKNGKEIYEGDIIQGHTENEYGSLKEIKAVIEWSEEFAGFTFKDLHPMAGSKMDNDKIQVIGNIYQNPELLTNQL